MKVNGVEIPDHITDEDGKGEWTAVGSFTAENLKNVRYDYERTVDGRKQRRWFKQKHFTKKAQAKEPATQ